MKISTRSITWTGLFSTPTGLGRAARELAKAVDSDHLKIYDIHQSMTTRHDWLDEKTSNWITKHSISKFDRATSLSIIHLPASFITHAVPQLWAPKKVVRAMYEVFPLPKQLVAILNLMDEVWVPSSFVASVFQKSGIHSERLVIIPDGVNTMAERPIPPPTEHLVFLSVFHWEDRKNPEKLLKAFSLAFANNKDVHLIIKTSGIEFKEIGSLLRYWCPDWTHWDQQCTIITEDLSDSQMATLYQQADVFVLLSRGEGFGLPYLEAMSYSIPVVAPSKGGHIDFCNHENSFLIPATEVRVPNNCDIALFRGSTWYDVDLSDTVDCFKHIYESQETIVAMGKTAYKSSLKWNWNNSRQIIRNRLNQILER